jgi:short-subunit dehydrogenase
MTNILIIGGEGSLGKNLLKEFAAQNNNNIFVTGKSKARLDKIISRIESDKLLSTHTNIIPVILNLENTLNIYELASFVYSKFGSLDKIIFCANYSGFNGPNKFIEDEEFTKAFKINVSSILSIFKAFDVFFKKPCEFIYFSHDNFTENNSTYQTSYFVTKKAQESLIQSFKQEYENIYSDLKIINFVLNTFESTLSDKFFPGRAGSNEPIEKIAKFIFNKLQQKSNASIVYEQNHVYYYEKEDDEIILTQ